MSIVAAGVAFYCFLAFVPTLGAVIAVYALVSDAEKVQQHVAALADIIPAQVLPVLEEHLNRLVAESHSAGISAAVSLFLALYGGSKAAGALIQGLNIAYGEKEKRSYLKLKVASLLMTLGAVVAAAIAIGLLAVVPSVLQRIPSAQGMAQLATWIRWPILVGGFMIALAIFYRYAPSREEPRWSWVSVGTGVATGLWLLGSVGFSVYVSTLGHYDKTYGSLGALVIFLFWLHLTAFAVLVGAEWNSEMERQTYSDTTDGPARPMGQRQARSADTVGPSRAEQTAK